MHTIRILTVAGAIALTGLGIVGCGYSAPGTATPTSTVPPAPAPVGAVGNVGSVAVGGSPAGAGQAPVTLPTHGTSTPTPTHVPPPPTTPPTTTPPPIPVHVPPAFEWTTFDLACWGMPLDATFGVTSDGPVNLTASVTYWTAGHPLPHVQTGATYPVAQHSSTTGTTTTTTFFDSLPVDTIHPFLVTGTLTATDADGVHTSKTFSVPVNTTCIA